MLIAATTCGHARLARADETPSEPDADRAPALATEVTEIEVRGAPLRHASGSPTVASTVIDGDDLKRPGDATADVLQRVPGVQVNRTGAQSDLATASIRGADANQVPVYLAGIRLNDDVAGTADLSQVPLFMIERVEVYRGNAPIEADRLGIGGAVFFWPRLPERTRAGLGAELGSFGTRGAWVALETGNAEAGSLVALRRSQADNDYPFVDDRGQRFDLDERTSTRQNADYQAYDVWAISRYRLPHDVRVTSILSAFHRTQGVTGLSTLPALETRGRSERLLFGNTAIIPCNEAHTCSIELNTSLLVASSSLFDPDREITGLGSYMVENSGERLSEGIGFRHGLGNDWKLTAKLVWAFENLRLDRADASGQRGNRQSLLPSGGLEWNATPDLLWQGVGALECHATEGTSVPPSPGSSTSSGVCSSAEPVGRLGARYRVGGPVHGLFNVGRYVRVPTLAELYGNSAFTAGNARLVPETAESVDLGVQAAFEPRTSDEFQLALDAFAFARRVHDLISYRRTSTQSIAPFNVGEARLLGAEVALALDALQHLRFEGNSSLTDPKETTDSGTDNPTTSDTLPFISRLTSSVFGEVYSKGFDQRVVSRAAFGIRYSYRSSRYADAAGQIVLPAQHWVDLEASTNLARERLLLSAGIKNLLDQQSTDFIGLPAPGRSYQFELEAWF